MNLTLPGFSTPQCLRIKVTRTVPFHLLHHDMSSATVAECLRTSNSPSSPSLDVKAECLASSILKAMNLLTPLRTSVVSICPQPKPHPWVTPELRLLQRKKNRLHQKQKKQPDDERLKQQYRTARYQCTQLNKRLKTQFCMRQFHELRRNPRAQWALLNKISGRASAKAKISAPLVDLHDAFASVVDDPHRPSILTVPQAPPESTPCSDTFEPVSFWNVECILSSLNTGKAAGSDGIPPSFLKMSRTAITRTVVEIVNESLKTGHFPTSYKLAHFCPVPKSSDPTVALNYRLISLLPVLSKVLERVVHQQVTRFFMNENPAAIPSSNSPIDVNTPVKMPLYLP